MNIQDSLDKQQRRAVHRADKYVRWKKYKCLIPGCAQTAIRSHAIPRAVISAALADKGVVYTQRQSFNQIIRTRLPTDPPDVVTIGVNDASVFNGFCPDHDARLFAPAERMDSPKRKHMTISLHLRAIAFEIDRKRRTADFLGKLASLTDNEELSVFYRQGAERYQAVCDIFQRLHLQSMFHPDSGVEGIDHFVIPFTKNLEVSCCGCLTAKTDTSEEQFKSLIAYNLISYPKHSFLALTSFTVVKKYLDDFVAEYPIPEHIERLVNDIAFFHSEEPLIAPGLWLGLSEEQKLALRLSLRYPTLRSATGAPTIIRIGLKDLVTRPRPMHPEPTTVPA